MVIIYLGNGSRKILDVLDEMDCTYKLVGDAQLDTTMKDLLQLNRFSRSRGECFMYFIDFPQERFQEFDLRMAQAHLDLPLMAIKTDQNYEWTLRQLMEGVQQEYEQFNVREDLIDALAQPDVERLHTDMNYFALIASGYQLLLDPNTSIEMIEKKYEMIKNYE